MWYHTPWDLGDGLPQASLLVIFSAPWQQVWAGSLGGWMAGYLESAAPTGECQPYAVRSPQVDLCS